MNKERMDVSGDGTPVNQPPAATVGEMETLLGDTIERMADLDERTQRMEIQVALIPEVKLLLLSMTSAQSLMAQSAQSMADTFRKSEERQERLEGRYEKVVETASGKRQVPLSLMVLVLVFFSIYVLVDKTKDSHLNVDIPWIGVHITQDARGPNLQ
jgi:hypothetical protein